MGWQSMATAGHFVTMLGVLAFYSTIFESHFEKKLTTYFFSLIPRLSKRICYYILKLVVLQDANKATTNIPTKESRLLIM